MKETYKKLNELKGNTKLSAEQEIERIGYIYNGKMIDWENVEFKITTRPGKGSFVQAHKVAYFPMIETTTTDITATLDEDFDPLALLLGE
jgi:hypothetical protein